MLALGSFLGTKRLHAEEPSKSVRDADTVVITGTRTPERSQRSTVKTDVVTREEAERRGATNVAEALATQPGVQVNPGAYGFLGGVSAIQIQGFDRDRVLILEDGERIVGDVGGAIDLSALPTTDLSRIEIVTGPTSSLYGSSALGGVVNIITQGPRQQGATGRARLEMRNPWGYVLQGNGAYRKGSSWVGLDLNAVQSEGIARRPGLPDLTVPETFRGMLGLRAGTELSDRVSVRVRLRAFRDRVNGLESQETPGLGTFLIDLPEATNRYTAHLIEEIKLARATSLRITLGHQRSENETKKDRRNSPLDEIRQRSHRMQSIESILTHAEGSRTWVFGARGESEHFSQDKTVAESLAEGVRTTSTQEVQPQGIGSGATYAQLQWKLHERFTVLPGARFEANTRYGTALSPRLAAAYRPSDTLILRLSGGRGFRAPSAKELGFVFDHSFYGYRVVGNTELRPETSWGVNADATWQPDKRITARVGGFANWVQNLIDLDIANGVTRGNVSEYTYTNFGRARTLGGQVDLMVAPNERFRFDSSYAYLHTRNEEGGGPLGGRPPHTVTNSIRVMLPAKLELYGRHRVVFPAALAEGGKTPGYQTVDLRLGRTLWPDSQAYIGVLNLLDAHQEPGRVGDLRPTQGRVLYAGLMARFPWEDSQ